MKRSLETIFRTFVILLLAVVLWSVWRAEAQTNQDATAAAVVVAGVTNVAPGNIVMAGHQSAAMPDWVERVTADFPVLNHRFLGNEAWKYLFSLIYVFLAFYVSKLLDFLTRVWLKRWAERTKTKFDDLILDLLNGPVKVVSFVVFLRIGLEVFSWGATVQMVLEKTFALVVVITITYTVLKFVDLVLGYWRLRVAGGADREFNEQLFPIVRKSFKIFIIIIAVLFVCQNIFEKNISAILASLSIGGLAIGLAAQDTLANLFGAVAVFVDKPFRIGDRIKLDSLEGDVETIGLRSTRVRTLDGHLASIPNKTVGNATIVNVTERPTIKTEMNLGVTYDTSSEQLRRALKIIEEVYRGHAKTTDLLVGFNKFADSALNIQVVHWWGGTDARENLAALQEMNLKLKERFDAEQINFAFPTQTLYVKQVAG